MKSLITISMTIGLTLVITSVINTELIIQKGYAAGEPSNSSRLGQSKGLGGVTTGGAGTAVQSGSNVGGVVVFCNTGVETPICKY